MSLTPHLPRVGSTYSRASAKVLEFVLMTTIFGPLPGTFATNPDVEYQSWSWKVFYGPAFAIEAQTTSHAASLNSDVSSGSAQSIACFLIPPDCVSVKISVTRIEAFKWEHDPVYAFYPVPFTPDTVEVEMVVGPELRQFLFFQINNDGSHVEKMVPCGADSIPVGDKLFINLSGYAMGLYTQGESDFPSQIIMNGVTTVVTIPDGGTYLFDNPSKYPVVNRSLPPPVGDLPAIGATSDELEWFMHSAGSGPEEDGPDWSSQGIFVGASSDFSVSDRVQIVVLFTWESDFFVDPSLGFLLSDYQAASFRRLSSAATPAPINPTPVAVDFWKPWLDSYGL